MQELSMLDTKLLEVLTTTTDALGTGVQFLQAEVPDVIGQLLLWYGVYSFLQFVGAVCIVGALIWWWGKYSSVTYDDDVPTFIGILMSVTTIVMGFYIFLLLNLQWLKIWIAPKLWLIEYTATLMKGG